MCGPNKHPHTSVCTRKTQTDSIAAHPFPPPRNRDVRVSAHLFGEPLSFVDLVEVFLRVCSHLNRRASRHQRCHDLPAPPEHLYAAQKCLVLFTRPLSVIPSHHFQQGGGSARLNMWAWCKSELLFADPCTYLLDWIGWRVSDTYSDICILIGGNIPFGSPPPPTLYFVFFPSICDTPFC